MKKKILTIITIAIILFLSVVLYNASKLQHIHIQKKVIITTDLESVFNNVVYLKTSLNDHLFRNRSFSRNRN